MKNWTIARRIIVGGASIIILLIVVAVTAVISLRQIAGDAVSIKEDSIPGLSQSSTMNIGLAEGFIRVILAGEAPNNEEREAFLKQLDGIVASNNAAFDAYAKRITDPEDRENFRIVTEKRGVYRKVRADFIALIRADKDAEANKLLHDVLVPAQMEYSKAADVLVNYNLRLAKQSSEEIASRTTATIWTVATVAVCALLAGVIFGIVVIRGVSKKLRSLGQALGSGADQVTSAATQVASSSQSLAQGASEQAASLEETSSSLEEMSGMTNRNAENATKANELARQARQAADTGAGDMQAMSAAMNDIKVSSDDIAKIIKTIDEIAFQTNILALNAAVEAARAGEAGMGFAVVADEVRNLAQRSAQAARETADKIEGAITKTGQGVQITEKVAKSLGEIVDKARQVDQLVGEVCTASREQSQGVQQITAAVTQMDKVVQSNAASAEESASAAEELNAQSFALREAVGELLGLVGGRDSGGAAERGGSRGRKTVRTPSIAQAAPLRRRGPAVQKSAPAFSMSDAGHGNNGHAA
jgi:methyl-accepting chemotaxis protein